MEIWTTFPWPLNPRPGNCVPAKAAGYPLALSVCYSLVTAEEPAASGAKLGGLSWES